MDPNEIILAAEDVKKLMPEWHTYWKQNGKPHPSSNLYLGMSRMFFYVKGIEAGVKSGMEIQKILEPDA